MQSRQIATSVTINEFGGWSHGIHGFPEQQKIFGMCLSIRPIAIRWDIQSCSVRGDAGEICIVTLGTCTCAHFQKTKLPCKHIYRLALELGYITVTANGVRLSVADLNSMNATARGEYSAPVATQRGGYSTTSQTKVIGPGITMTRETGTWDDNNTSNPAPLEFVEFLREEGFSGYIYKDYDALKSSVAHMATPQMRVTLFIYAIHMRLRNSELGNLNKSKHADIYRGFYDRVKDNAQFAPHGMGEFGYNDEQMIFSPDKRRIQCKAAIEYLRENEVI